MADIVIKPNQTGIRQLIHEPGVASDLQRRAQAVAHAATGEQRKYNVHYETGRNRARAAVVTADFHTGVEEFRGHHLARAVDAAR